MTVDFLKIARVEVSSTGAHPKYVIQEMEGELEKVADLWSGVGAAAKGVVNLGGKIQDAWKGAKAAKSSFKAGGGVGGMLSRGAAKADKAVAGGVDNFIGNAKRKMTAGYAGVEDIGIPTPSKNMTGPSTQAVSKAAPKADIPAGAPPKLDAPGASGGQATNQASAQAAGGPGFMQEHFGLTPGGDKGLMQGQSVGDWWSNLGKTNPNAQIKVMGAVGAAGVGGGMMAGGAGGGRSQVIYA
jgi:hypothetical protein